MKTTRTRYSADFKAQAVKKKLIINTLFLVEVSRPNDQDTQFEELTTCPSNYYLEDYQIL